MPIVVSGSTMGPSTFSARVKGDGSGSWTLTSWGLGVSPAGPVAAAVPAASAFWVAS
ncbi:hypothetical protein AEGHOMDF_2757 [Methylobacterium soli]|nr:hypothetical protein AEGHOMDF_2757 [Methylobacterium soli]